MNKTLAALEAILRAHLALMNDEQEAAYFKRFPKCPKPFKQGGGVEAK